MVFLNKDSGEVTYSEHAKCFTGPEGTVAHSGYIFHSNYKLTAIAPPESGDRVTMQVHPGFRGDSCVMATFVDGRLLCRGNDSYLFCLDLWKLPKESYAGLGPVAAR